MERRRDTAGPRTSARAFRPDIEGLRAVAILLVVAYHAGVPGFSGGFVGVDVFFVLSGYLITGLLFEELSRTGRIGFKQFYARRARRLLPGCALMLLATVAGGWFVFSPVEQQQFAGTALATAAYLSNVWFARNQMDYLGGDADQNPLLHTWSLGVEEQFYLVWPAFVSLVGRGRANGRQLVIGAMVLVAAASFALSLWMTAASPPWAFYSLPTRAWEFAVGAIAALQFTGSREPARLAVRVVTVTGFAAVAAASVLFTQRTPFPGWPALLPVLGTAAVLVGSTLAPGQRVLRPLLTAPFQAIGRLSYSWYLWHWPVLILAGAYFGHLGPAGLLVAAAASLGIAAAAHALVENPVRYAPFLVARPRLSLAVAAALTLFGVATARGWRLLARHAAAEPAQVRYAQARDDLPRVYAAGCHLVYGQVREPACAFADLASDTTVVLFGDSHAAQWFPALQRVADGRHWRLVSLTKSGCPAAEVHLWDPRLKRWYWDCDAWRQLSLRRIASLRPALVVISDASHYVAHGAVVPPDMVGDSEWTAGLRATLATLAAARVAVTVIADTPAPGYDVDICLSRLHWVHRPGGAGCTFPLRRAVDSLVGDDVMHAASGLPGVRVVSLSDAICRTDVCAPEQGGMVVYRDADHLTARYAASLAPALAARLGRAPRPAAAPAALSPLAGTP